MTSKTFAVTALLALVATSSAEARRASAEAPGGGEWPASAYSTAPSKAASGTASPRSERASTSSRGARSASASEMGSVAGGGGLGRRPSQWCGWYMRTRHGGGPDMNIAANWRRYGSPASPQVGAIVVWSHHVGEIVGQAPNGQWIVLSGNDSGAVRQRARSIAGAAVRI